MMTTPNINNYILEIVCRMIRPPFYIKVGCPLNYFIDLQTKKDLDKEKEAITTMWGLKDEYNLIIPGNYDTFRFSPPHYIAEYITPIWTGT